MADVTRAPWTVEQVNALNAFQRDGQVHPFTCANRDRDDVYRGFHEAAVVVYALNDVGQLIATTAGWACYACDYTQDWAYTHMIERNGDGRET